MALLPQKFGRAQKQARAHFPPYNVCPLVYQNGQVSIRLHPSRIHLADNGFGSGAHNQRLFQRRGWNELAVFHFKFGMCYNGAFLCKALYVFGFFLQKAYGNKQGEIRVFVPRVFKGFVESLLHIFPKGVAVGLNYHTASYGASFRQLRGLYNLLVPFGIVLRPSGGNSCFFCHIFINL